MRMVLIAISMIFFLSLFFSTGCELYSDSASSESKIIWGECPEYISQYGSAECAFVSMPVNYKKLFNERFDLFLWRIKGSSPESKKRGNIWFIQGGPGESSVAFSSFLPFLADAYPDWDYYSMDHRGIGNSNCLECPMACPDGGINPKNAAECYKEIQILINGTLDSYNVTNAAKDLHTVIKRTENLGKTFIYGVSYGTYLVQRFMTMYPDMADGIILDSIVPSDSKPLDNYDRNFNDVGKQIMNQCSQDEVCSERIGEISSDPWYAMEIVFGMIDDGSICNEFSSLTRKKLRNKLARLSSNMYGRALIPAVIYRLYRCNKSDISALNYLFSKKSELKAKNANFRPVDKLNSSVVFENISVSELYNGIPPWVAQEIVDTAYVSEDIIPDLAAIGYEKLWPAYYDSLIGKNPEYSRPVLMINSAVDGNTPLSLALGAAKYLHGPCQYFVTIPWAAHGAVFQSPAKDKLTPVEERIGVKIMMDFIADPYSEPDTSVLDECYILEFSGSSVENRFVSEIFFGTTDMWD